MSVNTVDHRSASRMLFRAIALFLSLLVPSAASATDVWAGATGDPCCGLPPEFWKYLDANEVCEKEFPLPPAFACNANPRNLRNYGGPQVQSICAYDTTCTCNTCALATDPNPTLTYYYGHTLKKTQSCSAETPWEHLGLCYTDTPKGKGPCVDCENLARANPVNIGSGNKYQSETVYRAASGQLELVLFYNSQAGTSYFESMVFGPHWSVRSLGAVRDWGQGIVAVPRPDGRALQFRAPASGNLYLGDADIAGRLEKLTDGPGNLIGWRYTASEGDEVEEFDAAGKLLLIRNRAGLQQAMTYSSAGTPASIAPAAGLLIAVTDSFGRQLGFTYNAQRRVNSSVHALGVGLYSFNYGPGTSTASLDSLGTSRSVGLQRTLGVARGTGTTQPAANGSGTVSTSATYDANGNIASRTDWNGNQTIYAFDPARNLEISRTEANGTPQQRTTSTDWHPTFRLPTQIVEPLRTTTSVYDADGAQCGARGALCSRSVQATSGATRTWTYTYNANGQVLTVNGPRSDVSDITTYTYDTQGNVASISNAAGHVTSITAYNAHGQPLTIVDPNGMTITPGYDARQRLTSRNSGGEITTYDYDGVGHLTKVTLPDGSFLSYSYDAAHRLTGMADNLGNSIAYTLDAMGNRTQEEVFDPANVRVQKRTRDYDSLNRLFHEFGAQNQPTEYGYDDQGNVVSMKDPLNHVTANQYDALNRLKQVTDPALA